MVRLVGCELGVFGIRGLEWMMEGREEDGGCEELRGLIEEWMMLFSLF